MSMLSTFSIERIAEAWLGIQILAFVHANKFSSDKQLTSDDGGGTGYQIKRMRLSDAVFGYDRGWIQTIQYAITNITFSSDMHRHIYVYFVIISFVWTVYILLRIFDQTGFIGQ